MKQPHFKLNFIASVFSHSTLKSLFVKNLIYLFAIIAIPLMSLALLFNLYNFKSIKRNFYSEIEKDLIEINSELENEFGQNRKVSYALAYDGSVNRFASLDSYKLSNDVIAVINEVKSKLIAYQASSLLTTDMGLVYLEPTYHLNSASSYSLFNFSDYNGSERMDKFFVESIIESIQTGTGYRMFLSDQGLVSICLLNSRGEVSGAVYALSSISALNNLLNEYIGNTFNNYALADLDQNKIYVYGSNAINSLDADSRVRSLSKSVNAGTDTYSEVVLDGRKYLSASSMISEESIVLILLADVSVLVKDRQYATAISVILFVALLLLSALASSYISWRFHQPIDVVIDLLRNPTPKVVTEYKESYEHLDELGIISTLISETRFREALLKDELEEKEETLDKLQKMLLQTQINPHFINNTLETINWKAIEALGDTNEVSEMLSDFSKLLARSFRGLGQLVTLASELEHARLYIKIQQSRFGNMFTTAWEIDKGMLDHFTVPIIIQPLLENAVKYGVKPLKNIAGSIVVSCEKDTDRIEIGVFNTCDEKSESKLEEMRRQLGAEPSGSGYHIGMSSVHHRVQLAFGHEYGLSVERIVSDDVAKSGLKVNISIPIVEKPTL
jgi:two-component system, sensor histidine kinase YesM